MKLGEIFDALDSGDHDGIITAKKIELTHISAELLEIFKPLLCELEQMDEYLDKEEFIDSALRLYQVITSLNLNLCFPLDFKCALEEPHS